MKETADTLRITGMSDENKPTNPKHPYSGLTAAETDELEAAGWTETQIESIPPPWAKGDACESPERALALVRSPVTIDAMLEGIAATMERSSGARAIFEVSREGQKWYIKASSNGMVRFNGSGETIYGAVRNLAGYIVADATMRAHGLRADADALIASVAVLTR